MEWEGWEVRWVGAPQEIEGVREWPRGVVGAAFVVRVSFPLISHLDALPT
jgi:hypothetical protein